MGSRANKFFDAVARAARGSPAEGAWPPARAPAVDRRGAGHLRRALTKLHHPQHPLIQPIQRHRYVAPALICLVPAFALAAIASSLLDGSLEPPPLVCFPHEFPFGDQAISRTPAVRPPPSWHCAWCSSSHTLPLSCTIAPRRPFNRRACRAVLEAPAKLCVAQEVLIEERGIVPSNAKSPSRAAALPRLRRQAVARSIRPRLRPPRP